MAIIYGKQKYLYVISVQTSVVNKVFSIVNVLK